MTGGDRKVSLARVLIEEIEEQMWKRGGGTERLIEPEPYKNEGSEWI